MLEQVQPVDLIKGGFIPEFIGRLPVVAVLEDLSRDALVQILTQAEERDYHGSIRSCSSSKMLD